MAADWQYNTLDSDMALFVFPSRHQLLGSVATALNFGGLRLRASLLANSIHDRTRPIPAGRFSIVVIPKSTPLIFTSPRFIIIHRYCPLPENHIQPWYTSDISAAYSFGLGNTMLRISLEINNLADQQYEVIRNYPMPGRNYKVIAQWNF